MLETPFLFEEWLRPTEFQQIGKMALRWSHIEHIIGNCLKVMLRLDDQEAILVVFPLNLNQRLEMMKKHAKQRPLQHDAQEALDELLAVMNGIQYVRNTVIHSVMSDNAVEGTRFHLRSKERFLPKEQVLAVEELTNYAAHAVMSLRYALGMKGEPGQKHPLPERPPIPDFLREKIPAQKKKAPQL